MNHDDSVWSLLRFLGQIILIVWLVSRRNNDEDRPVRRQQPMADGHTLGGWARPGRWNHEPAPTPSPRSHPLWDRDLDG